MTKKPKAGEKQERFLHVTLTIGSLSHSPVFSLLVISTGSQPTSDVFFSERWFVAQHQYL